MLSQVKKTRSQSANEPSLPALAHPSFNNEEIPSDILRCLKETRLVDDKSVESLLPLMNIRRLAGGDLIIREGVLGRSIFIVLQGLAVVYSESTESEIGELGPGNVIGEIGGLLDVPRTMTIRAKGTGCTVGVILREDVLKVPGLTQTLLRLAQSRLAADEAREKRLLLACPSKLAHLDAAFEQVFGSRPKELKGRYVKRADQWILLLTSRPVHVHVVEGGVRVRSASTGSPEQRYSAGEEFSLEAGEEPRVIQAVDRTCIYYHHHHHHSNGQEESISSEGSTQSPLLHTESKDSFGAALEQASRLSQIIAGNSTHRRSSIAVWSDESFLRPLPLPHGDADTSPERKRRQMSEPALPRIVEGPADVVDLLERMGVPAGQHRSAIRQVFEDGTLGLNMDPVHQYFDNEVLEALLIMAGPRISSLCLYDCWSLSDASLLKVLQGCPRLRALRLSNCWSLTEAGLKAALSQLPPGLGTLEIRSCAGMTAGCLEGLGAGMEALDLSYCKNLGEGTWEQLCRLAPSLRALSLRRCTRISGEDMISALRSSSAQFTEMRELDLMDCAFLSDAAICTAVAACPALHRLNISFCQDLDASFFTHLAKANTSASISALVVEHCAGLVTDPAVRDIARHWTELAEFRARGCSLLTNGAVTELAQMPALRVLDLSSCPRLDGAFLIKTALVRRWILVNPPNLFG